MDASHPVLDTPTDIGAPWSKQREHMARKSRRQAVATGSDGRVAKRPRSRMSPMRPLLLVVPRI